MSAPGCRGGFFCLFSKVVLSAFLVSSLSFPLFAQTSVSQGSIQGTVSDQTNAVVPGATITIKSLATGQVVTVKTSSSGTYNSGGLPVGDYQVRVSAKGFKTEQLTISVQITVTSSGNVKLEVGQETTTVEVQSSSITVNTEQSVVQGVLNGEQIDNMPVNGRSFLDLAQLEPGVQMQDGQNFDPTKVGYNSISINGDYGRTPRIEVDGLDVSDETVGTTTQNIALSSIQEFSIGRSSLDISTEITSSGSVNLATRSGTNEYHGQAFYLFRDYTVGFADLPGAVSPQFQRNQFGGRFGGALIKNKLFFFIDSERLKQDSANSIVAGAPFQFLTQGIDSPFKSSQASGRLDWQATQHIRVFYKFAYDWNYSTSSASTGFSYYANRDYAPTHAVGIDISEGNWSHSIRFGYFKFHNQIIGDTNSQPLSINPFPSAEILFADTNLGTGPNYLAPQQTFQSNKQIKYDASRVLGAHILRFGGTVNRISTGGFASFNGLAPLLYSYVNFNLLPTGSVQTTPFYSCNLGTNFSGCDPNIADYPFAGAYLGNGQGFSTELPAFGYPAGGLFDTRFEAYAGDSWKIKPNFTLNYGLRYIRDTGRTDSDLAPIPCSATTLITCTGNLLDQWGPGLGNRVRQPNLNFAPQIGFAWDPWHNGKTAIRGGGGLYYENNIFNNVSYDRSNKLATGLFNQTPYLNCEPGASAGSLPFYMPLAGSTQGTPVYSVDGYDLATQVCFAPLGPSSINAEGAAKAMTDLQAQYIAATAAVGAAGANPNFVGNTLELGYPYNPNFRTARSYQMNIGIQRELIKGGVLTVDYLRNIGLHFQVGVDVNHAGDSRYLEMNAALNAINATVANAGCAPAASVAQAQAAVACYIQNDPGASINDFAGNGLDSGGPYYGGYSAPYYGLTADTGAAFGGINPNVGSMFMNYPMGRSVYNGLQSEWRQHVKNPFRGVGNLDLQVNYTLSRFVSDGGSDQHFTPNAWDFRNPTAFMGPTAEDRTHQFKFGATFEFAHHGPRLSLIGGFASPQPSDLRLPTQGTVGEIFRSDLTGDGTTGDFLNSAANGIGHPGTFMRSVSSGNLNAYLTNFNNTVGNGSTLTPAGQTLVTAGLFTQSQLVTLGAVVPSVQAPPANNAGNGYYKDVDTILSWPFKFRERVTISPSVSFFNTFNFVNFGALSGLTGGGGAINGTVSGANADTNTVRIGRGSGVFAVGAPREAEFGLRFDF